jgi:ribulose-5-phosphate 4-epimerase/fuculose-1-phosphate aldolase
VAQPRALSEQASRSLRRDVAVANHIAHAVGLVSAFGHVSARVPGTDTFLIPTRASPMLADPERLLRMDCDGRVLEGEGTPNSEFWIHARLYAARPDVGGVAHMHSPACVGIGQLGRTVRALHNSGAAAGTVPVFERVGLIRSRELGDQAAAALGRGTALLLRGHGANVAAADVRRAIVVACFLEEGARLQLQMLAAAGGDERRLRYFDTEELERVRSEIDAGRPMARAWQYYAALVGEREEGDEHGG